MKTHRIRMQNKKTVKPWLLNKSYFSDLFLTAYDKFPYNLVPTMRQQGDIDVDDFVAISEEFAFDIRTKLGDTRRSIEFNGVARGWIDMKLDDATGEISISGSFTIGRDEDCRGGKLLADNVVLRAYYNLPTQTWDLNIDFCRPDPRLAYSDLDFKDVTM